MRNALSKTALPARLFARAMSVMIILLVTAMAAAQQPSPKQVDIQRGAMRKLAFLTGHWSGPITIVRSSGEPLKLAQSENVQFKLDGLVLLIEGKSAGTDGKAQFEALATVAFDTATQSYRFRAYHDDNYLDAPLTVLVDGFSWEYTSGPARVVNTMRLTAKGEWKETTDVTFGNNPPRRSVEMLLAREQQFMSTF